MRCHKLLTKVLLFPMLTNRYRLMIVFSSLFISCNLCFLINSAQSFPSKEISLSDWGLSHPSQIGHLSLGILHKKDGDEIVLYDIREHKPVLKTPEGPRGRTPSFEGDFFLVSHFSQGNINRLGGYFNGFAKHPSKSAVSISKTSGDSPALAYYFENQSPGFSGFWIHLFNFKAPPSEQVFLDTTPFAYLTFSFRGEKGDEKIMLRTADRVMEKKEDSYLIGEVSSFLPQGKVNKEWQTAWVPLSRLDTRIDRKELANVVFQVSGNGSGRIFVKDLAFARKKGVTISSASNDPVPSCPSNKAMWLWETEKILKDPEEQKTFLDFSKRHRLTDVFVQIPYEAEKGRKGWTIFWDSAGMPQLISRLSLAGVRVHALDGDPRFALREWHGRSIGLLEKIIQYNQTVSPRERFYGIRYDNEPYLLPQFGGIHKERVLKEYLELAEKSQALAQKAGLIFGVDIPFWFDGSNEFFEPAATLEGRLMSERIIDVVDNVGIMDYRTVAYGADGVIEHGTNELKYADKKGKKVFIGLETVWLPDETIYDFGPRGGGSRVLIKSVDSQKIPDYLYPERGNPRFPGSSTFAPDTPESRSLPASSLSNRKALRIWKKSCASRKKSFAGFPVFMVLSYIRMKAIGPGWKNKKHQCEKRNESDEQKNWQDSTYSVFHLLNDISLSVFFPFLGSRPRSVNT